LNIKDFCNECGNCESFCPSSGAPYRDKPRLHLTKSSFSETEEGFYFEADKLLFKRNGAIHSLQKNGNLFYYSSDEVDAQLRVSDFQPERVILHKNEQVRFDDAIKMSIIYDEARKIGNNVEK
jgi:putative selenate reductase